MKIRSVIPDGFIVIDGITVTGVDLSIIDGLEDIHYFEWEDGFGYADKINGEQPYRENFNNTDTIQSIIAAHSAEVVRRNAPPPPPTPEEQAIIDKMAAIKQRDDAMNTAFQWNGVDVSVRNDDANAMLQAEAGFTQFNMPATRLELKNGNSVVVTSAEWPTFKAQFFAARGSFSNHNSQKGKAQK